MSFLLRVPERKIACAIKTCIIHSALCHDIAVTINTDVSTSDSFKIETILDSKRHQQVVNFMHDNFYPRNSERKPNAQGNGMFSLIEEIPESLNQGVSLLAIDTNLNNQVAGVAVNNILTRFQPIIDRPSPYIGVNAYRTCLRKLQVESNVFENKNVKRGMNLAYLGVKERFERRGLAQNLTEHSIQLAQHLKLDFIQSITFCQKTLNLFEKLQFETVTSFKLIDHWISDGIPAFPNAGPDDIVYFVFKAL